MRNESEADVLANRRGVDLYAGITDPVELLKLVHKPHKYDPLVHWVPCAIPTDRLYLTLRPDQQLRMAGYAQSLIGTQRHDEAEAILGCLGAFTDVRMDHALRALIDHGSFWPYLAFRNASEEIRDSLIERIEWDAGHRRFIRCALAWIGDAVVVELFARWRKNPPSWYDVPFIPNESYPQVAGWELTDDDQRRDLYFQDCVALHPGTAEESDRFQVITNRADTCQWCGQALVNLLDVSLTELTGAEHAIHDCDRVQVVTCEACAMFCDPMYGTFNEHGIGSWSQANVIPDYWSCDGEYSGLPRSSMVPAGRRSALAAADIFLPTTFSQIGGRPAWVDNVEYPHCPVCSRTMMFLAQVNHEEMESYCEGFHYAFVCTIDV
ncbi:MAG: DUF1963 domain-containing protein [Bacteroidetes bacterium]|nr:DUF1963 domain-containing protein [Bacteroidota bacterium]